MTLLQRAVVNWHVVVAFVSYLVLARLAGTKDLYDVRVFVLRLALSY